MKYILNILLISFSWCIGFQGMIIPENGYVLSTAGTGIAEGTSSNLNPAMYKLKNSYIQFSLNNWLNNIQGSQAMVYWGDDIPQSFSVQTWNANNIPLWGNNPASESLGDFSVHYISASYSISHDLKTPYRFGLSVQTHYSHLFSESISSMSLNIGALFSLTSFIEAGLVLNNIGYESTNNIKAELPTELGFGLGIDLPFNVSLLTDAIYISENGIDTRIGVKTHWKSINLHAGTSINKKRNANALGFSFNYRSWSISYGIYNHENSNLGIPQFFDIRRYI